MSVCFSLFFFFFLYVFFFLRIRRPPRSTLDRSSAASDVYKRQLLTRAEFERVYRFQQEQGMGAGDLDAADVQMDMVMSLATRGRKDYNGINTEGGLSLIHISEPTRPY